MSDGFMSSWHISPSSGQRVTKREETSARLLPGIHFRGNVLLDVRRTLLFARPGETLGIIRGYRSSQPEDDVLFDALFPETAAAAIRPGAVVAPLALSAGLRRPWREGRIGGDGSLLKLFGSVASPALLDEGRGVRIRLRVTLPRFLLTQYEPLRRDACPDIAEVSLGIVLSGGETVREGERIGFLVRDPSNGNVVEPVLLNDSVGRRGIIGMWTLCPHPCGRDTWGAAAVFAADSMIRRNAKISRKGTEMSSRREVDFLVAQFHERVGGAPVFVPCTVTLPSLNEVQHVSYSAEVSGHATDVALIQGSVVSARFHEEGNPVPPFCTDAQESDSTGDGASREVDIRENEDETGDIGLRTREAGQSSSLNVAESVGESSSESPQTASGVEVVSRGGILSPTSQAQVQLEEIARQMQSLQAELGEIPGEGSGMPPVSRRDSGNKGLILGIVDPSAPGPVASNVAEASTDRAWSSARGVRNTGESGGNRGAEEFGPANLSDSDDGGQSVGGGINGRLDELARKYVGANYWSDLKLDEV